MLDKWDTDQMVVVKTEKSFGGIRRGWFDGPVFENATPLTEERDAGRGFGAAQKQRKDRRVWPAEAILTSCLSAFLLPCQDEESCLEPP